MKVELVLLRNIIIEDSFNIVNVYSASDDIGRNKNIKFAAPVVIHDAVARTLTYITVKCFSFKSLP